MKVRFDAVAMYATVAELARKVEGGKIRRIQQLGPDLYLFTVFRPRGVGGDEPFEGPESRFLISLGAASARIHAAERPYGSAETPTSFCMLLRKHLEGARIQRLHTVGLERVAVIELMPHEHVEAGMLVVSLLPTGRTLVLVDRDGRVMGEARHKMRKGTPYPLPPQEGHAVDVAGLDVAARLRGLDDGLVLEKALTRCVFGIGTLHGREIAVRAGLDPRAPYQGPDEALAHAWDRFWTRLREGPLQPATVAVGEEERLLLPFPFESQAGRPSTEGPSMNHLVEEAFSESLGQAGLESQRAMLLDAVARQRERAARRIAAQQGDLDKAGQYERWRVFGELLTANIFRIPARARTVTLEDYTVDGSPAVEIPLDPDLSPQDNARVYYDRYKKAKRGLEAIAEAIERSRQEVDYLDTLASSVETARERDDLREIEAQMKAERMLPGATPKKRPKGPAARPRRFQVDGWDILVGRNPQQNELLTMRQSRPDDWWLHARQIPGAHVIARGPGGAPTPPDQVLVAAARLAAAFSKAASANRVPVDYTRVRYVKKPPGTPAGYVTYSREQTLNVEPARDLGDG